MTRPGEELIDFLLGELSPEREREVARRIADDPGFAAERDRLVEAQALIRAAAAEGWEESAAPEQPAARIRWLRPIAAAAAVLMLAVLPFVLRAKPSHAHRVFEPEAAYGYLLPEETDSQHFVLVASTATQFLFRAGKCAISPMGSEQEFPLGMGEEIAPDSDLNTPVESGARIDLPNGGILFLGPLSTIRMRMRDDGRAALRLLAGSAATVVEGEPLHLGIEDSDLLMVQESGAAFVRRTGGRDAICLRGDLWLQLADGGRFRIPPGERLPSACAKAPETARITTDDIDLDWYRSLVYEDSRIEPVTWAEPGRSIALETSDDDLLYLRALAHAGTTLRIAFGGSEREYRLDRGCPFELRIPIRELGPGPVLTVEPAEAIREARLFSAKLR